MTTPSPIPDDMQQACCNTCLLSPRMMDCQDCEFNLWKGFKALKSQDSEYPENLREARIKALINLLEVN